MKAFIFAAGNGSRMNCPDKILLRIGNSSLIGRIIEQLENSGVKEIVIGVCDTRVEERILNEFPYNAKMNVVFVYNNDPESSMLTTLKAAKIYLEGEKTFACICADEWHSHHVIMETTINDGYEIKVVDTINNPYSSIGVMRLPGTCFKYMEDRPWLRDRNDLAFSMITSGVHAYIYTKLIDGYIININTWDAVRYARRIVMLS